MSPRQCVPSEQATAFHLAVCERLGLDPAIVSASDFNVDIVSGDELSPVSLTAFLPTEEVVAMFNAAGRPTY